MSEPRHSWSKPARFLHKSERVCQRCGLVKVTRHEGFEHWVEWWRDGERLHSERTPPCTVSPTSSAIELQRSHASERA